MLTFVSCCAFLFNGEPQAVEKSHDDTRGLRLHDKNYSLDKGFRLFRSADFIRILRSETQRNAG